MIESGIFENKSRFQFFSSNGEEQIFDSESTEEEVDLFDLELDETESDGSVPNDAESNDTGEGEDEDQVPKSKFVKVMRMIFKTLYHLRGLFLAIPVIILALRFANYNSEHLPLMVGLNLQSNGEYAKMISRETAVNTPVYLTLASLGVMCISRKPIYPWLISLFTLAIPVLLLLTNMYPM